MTRKEVCGLVTGKEFSPDLIKAAAHAGFVQKVLSPAPLPDDLLPHRLEYTVDQITDKQTVMAFGASLDVLYVHSLQVNISALENLEQAGVKIFPTVANLKDIVAFNQQSLVHQLTNGINELVEETISVTVSRFTGSSIICFGPGLHVQLGGATFTDTHYIPEQLTRKQTHKILQTAASLSQSANYYGLISFEFGVLRNGSFVILQISPGLIKYIGYNSDSSNHNDIEPIATQKATEQLASKLAFPGHQNTSGNPLWDIHKLQQIQVAVETLKQLSKSTVQDYWLTQKRDKQNFKSILTSQLTQQKYLQKTLHL